MKKYQTKSLIVVMMILTAIFLSSPVYAKKSSGGLLGGLDKILKEAIVDPFKSLLHDVSKFGTDILLHPFKTFTTADKDFQAALVNTVQAVEKSTGLSKTSGKTILKEFAGGRDTVAGEIEAYKAPTTFCSKKDGCYSTVNSNNLFQNKELNSTQQKTAQQYMRNASGSISGIKKPLPAKEETPNMAAVKYHIYYKKAVSRQSIQATNFADQVAKRTSIKSLEGSAENVLHYVTEGFTLSENIMNSIAKDVIPFYGTIKKVEHAAGSLVTNVGKSLVSFVKSVSLLSVIVGIGHDFQKVTTGMTTISNYTKSQHGGDPFKKNHYD